MKKILCLVVLVIMLSGCSAGLELKIPSTELPSVLEIQHGTSFSGYLYTNGYDYIFSDNATPPYGYEPMWNTWVYLQNGIHGGQYGNSTDRHGYFIFHSTELPKGRNEIKVTNSYMWEPFIIKLIVRQDVVSMLTKICHKCNKPSYSTRTIGEWLCPYCNADLTEQPNVEAEEPRRCSLCSSYVQDDKCTYCGADYTNRNF